MENAKINKYPYKAQGRKMKVLIETITSRRGYKNFADEAELDDFLAHNHNKITDYQILLEDDDGLNEQLQNVAKQCEMLENHLIQLFLLKPINIRIITNFFMRPVVFVKLFPL